MDFTLKTYRQLLQALLNHGYVFQTFQEYIKKPYSKVVVMRHDVDRIPQNAFKLAQLEAELDVKSIYYFRMVSHVFKPEIINKIAELGHEIGYHYEDLTLQKGNIDRAYDSFCTNLEELRKLYPVKNICMHGSPLSKWDSKKIWDKYDYKKLGIIAEPYFDIDYNEVFYLTDTGRTWNNENISVRDKVNSGFNIRVKSTQHLIQLAESGQLPNKIMINTHPNRWFNPGFGWVKELVMQNIKNVVKYYLIKRRN